MNDRKKIFVVGASRSGKTTLIKVFQNNAISKVHDEDKNQFRKLNYLAKKYYYKKNIDIKNNLSKLLPKDFSISANPAYYSLIPVLNEIYPKSKYIFVNRNCYSQIKTWMDGKLYSILDPYPFSRFKFKFNVNRFEKCCYHWKMLNDEIYNNLRDLDYISIKFEDLINGKCFSKISKFIDNPIDEIKNPIFKINLSPSYSDNELEIMKKICSHTMVNLGYAI